MTSEPPIRESAGVRGSVCTGNPSQRQPGKQDPQGESRSGVVW